MGKLSRDTIPVRPKTPCLAARMIVAGLDDDDLEMVAVELAGGMTMSVAYQWIAPTFPSEVSDSAVKNHLKGRCSCPDGVPLLGAVD